MALRRVSEGPRRQISGTTGHRNKTILRWNLILRAQGSISAKTTKGSPKGIVDLILLFRTLPVHMRGISLSLLNTRIMIIWCDSYL